MKGWTMRICAFILALITLCLPAMALAEEPTASATEADAPVTDSQPANPAANGAPVSGQPANTTAGPAVQSLPLSSSLVVTGYQVLSDGRPASSIRKGDKVILVLSLMNTGITTQQAGDVSQLDVSRLVDSFSTGGTPQVQILSGPNDPLQCTIQFPDCTYNGQGRSFRCMLGYRALSLPYDQAEISLGECVEYTAPEPTQPPAPVAVPAPSLRLSRSDVPLLKAGDEAVITLFFTNMGRVSMDNALATITTSDSLILTENAASFPLGNLASGNTAALTLRFKAAKTVSAEQQTITAEVKFTYYNGEAPTQGAASDRVNLLSRATDPNAVQMDGPVPNVILQRYTYGESGQQVAAGSEFSLKLDFLNTSEKKKLENVVMTLEPGEGLSLCDSSNTFYYASLGKQESKAETVRLMALPTAKPGAAEVTVTFKYEYVDNHKRNQVTLPQKLSIPLYQPDRFEVTLANPPQDATVGQETTLTLQYYNKGRSDVTNVQAQLPSSIPALSTMQNLGNLEPGKSGTINFVLTPDEAGELRFNVKISYEDAGGQVREKEVPVSFNVEEPYYDPADSDDLGMDAVEEEKKSPLPYILIGVGGLALIGGGVLFYLKKRGAKQGEQNNYEWKDEEA